MNDRLDELARSHRGPSPTPPPVAIVEARSRKPNKAIIVLAVLGGLLVIGLILRLAGFNPPSSPRPELQDTVTPGRVWVAAQEFVKRRLVSPSTADFGWQDPSDCVRGLGGLRFRASGWVDAKNRLGVPMRSTFTVELEYTGNSNWELLSEPAIREP